MRLADLSNPESLLQTGQSLARAGDLQTGLSLAQLGRQMQTEQRQREAGQQFNQMLGGILGGGMQPNAAPPVQRAPSNQSASLGNGPLPASLIQNESGGRFDARNDAVGSGGQVGHFGRAQFGQARLQDAMAAGAIPQGTTPEQFMANPQLQQAAEAWHVNDLNRQIEARGLTRFEGQTINGAPVTRQGILAGAHLGGIGGVTRYLASGGQFNPADANGTRIGDYVARHGGGGQQVAQAGGMPQQPAQGGFDPSRLQQMMPALITALGDPDLPASTRQQIQMLMQMGQRQDNVTTAAPGSAIIRNGQVVGVVPERASTPEGFRRNASGDLETIPGGPADPRVVRERTQAQAKPNELSAGDRRLIAQAEDELPRLRGTMETLQRAAQLNERAFTGLGAGPRSAVGNSGVPLARELSELGGGDARASSEFFSIMNQEAIKAMSETLKGATTDAEMQRFIADLGNPNTPIDVRARTIDRMQRLAQRQIQIAEDRINQMRGGTYFRPGGGPSQPGQAPQPNQAQGQQPNMNPQDAARAELRRRGLIP
jgi:hypothetical protein